MKTLLGIAAAIFCLGSTASAARIDLPDIGASIDVPSGWVLSHPSPHDYYWQDTSALGYRGVIGVTAYDSAGVDGTRAWVIGRTRALKTTIESDPQSVLYVVDSTGQDGHFAMYLSYLGIYTDTSGSSLALAYHDRFVAWGQTGYNLYTYGDTADFYPNSGYYAGLLDSIKLDNGFAGLGKISSGIAARSRPSAGFSMRNGTGGSVEFRLATSSSHEGNDDQYATVMVYDPKGHLVWSAPLAPSETARWNPYGTGTGTYFVRVSRAGALLGASTLVRLP